MFETSIFLGFISRTDFSLNYYFYDFFNFFFGVQSWNLVVHFYCVLLSVFVLSNDCFIWQLSFYHFLGNKKKKRPEQLILFYSQFYSFFAFLFSSTYFRRNHANWVYSKIMVVYKPKETWTSPSRTQNSWPFGFLVAYLIRVGFQNKNTYSLYRIHSFFEQNHNGEIYISANTIW